MCAECGKKRKEDNSNFWQLRRFFSVFVDAMSYGLHANSTYIFRVKLIAQCILIATDYLAEEQKKETCDISLLDYYLNNRSKYQEGMPDLIKTSLEDYLGVHNIPALSTLNMVIETKEQAKVIFDTRMYEGYNRSREKILKESYPEATQENIDIMTDTSAVQTQ